MNTISNATALKPLTLITGAVERDLFDHESIHGHRTFLGTDGHHYTGVDCWDREYVCSLSCLATYLGDDTPTATSTGTAVDALGEDDDFSYVFSLPNSDSLGEVNVAPFDVHNFDPADDGEEVLCATCERVIAGVPSDDFAAQVLAAFLVAAVWSETDALEEGDEPQPLDAMGFTVDDLTASAVATAADDVRDFLKANWGDVHNMDPAQVGQDFLLTRNRHGAGFWDRGLGDVGDRLTDACRPYGSYSLYVVDGEVHAL